jgi:RNA polymerase sigma-70 factor (ECF subfamily)
MELAPGRSLSCSSEDEAVTVGAGHAPDDLESFRRAMLPHMDAAYAYARFLSRDPVAAEDVVQEAYLRAFRGFAGYRGGNSKAWLLAIVRTSFFDSTRGRRDESAEANEEEADAADTPEEALIRAADAAALRRAVDGLPEPFRETLVLRELEEMSYREIGDLMKAPLGTIMSRLSRARRMLASALIPGERR